MATIDKIDYLGTIYDLSDANAIKKLDGGEDGQVMVKKGDVFEWADKGGGSTDIVGFGSYTADATSCVVAMSIPNTSNYVIKTYSSSTGLIVSSVAVTSTQVQLRFNKQSTGGEICVVARKVG